MDRDLAPTVLVGAGDGDLQGDGALLGEDQRRLQGQLLDALGADLLAGPQRQLEEGGAGQEDGAGDGVVGKPGMGGERDPPGEGQAPSPAGSSIAAPSNG